MTVLVFYRDFHLNYFLPGFCNVLDSLDEQPRNTHCRSALLVFLDMSLCSIYCCDFKEIIFLYLMHLFINEIFRNPLVCLLFLILFYFGWIRNLPLAHLSPRHPVSQRCVCVCGGSPPLPAGLIGSAGVIEWQMNSGFLKEMEGE